MRSRRLRPSPRTSSRKTPRRTRTIALAAGALVLAGVGLAGCERTVVVEAAEDAQNPKCADIMLRLPDEISGEKERTTSSQGTKAWGDPNIAVARCGVTPPGPTTDQCVSVSGVDWISKASDEDDTWVFTSYGRTPAVEVLVNRKAESGNDVLAAISPALAAIKPEAECVGAQDLDS
ncbi:MAG: DUF3515 domain-containing protein [Brevibacterium sp.]|uniref:DUF3515 domain-containing protein n=1 Tax=Brevibacterium sp. TaxID=1701 RepID=UPI002648BD29|nr:DUF3515 domain-containing protein [Brevibacterium sp.]MDN5808312.1 DUF3515 domain-containing protein [Brevibacterium sp.]MDN5834844.1 DUF3515 domain-containing protein [Brevibacterium sp.]MDN5877729.1 DUF3515 domain-containing protein [Brevibacterium sp.]MDN6134743.1 DUF3515 domain-containing protein [Brevibacterium sp.]MDN6158552.1 DUF3515 domain-containing protein [Brevibacterium sp.]